MKILFTGGSSFTGFWFLNELHKADYEIYATFTKSSKDKYTDMRKERINKLLQICEPVWDCNFGDDKFIKILQNGFDILCHHGAQVYNYNSPNFDYIYALERNTHNIQSVMKNMCNLGTYKIILTGSVFEQDEGIGSGSQRAFSSYGLSKGLTYQVFKYYAKEAGIKLGKFVISNPFGPYEEPRFTSYLVSKWMQNKVPDIKTPRYIRDNIHVRLLAKAYVKFVLKVEKDDITKIERMNPSGYVESQEIFTRRFADEIRKRTDWDCQYTLLKQENISQPLVRINSESAIEIIDDWNEKKAWDELVEFYLDKYEINT